MPPLAKHFCSHSLELFLEMVMSHIRKVIFLFVSFALINPHTGSEFFFFFNLILNIPLRIFKSVL